MHNKSYTQGKSDGSNFKYLKYGVVVSVKDNDGLGRIKVRVKGSKSVGGDDEFDDSELPWAFPFIPKYLSTIPKKNDAVWILILDDQSEFRDRLYIGPIISQLQYLDGDNFFNGTSPLTAFSFGGKKPTKPVLTDETTDVKIPELLGVFPKADEVSIQGRYNTDITQKRNEIIIRAGKFEETDTNEFKIKFNFKTQGFIQIKNDVPYFGQEQKKGISVPKEGTTERGSVTNIVSNKINLITHKDGAPLFTLTNEELLNNEEIQKILTEAHQLPFGDILLEYLILLKQAIFSHVHNGNGNPATDLATSGNIQAIAALKAKAEDLESKMLSKNIRIN